MSSREESFWAKVRRGQEDECWEWLGARTTPSHKVVYGSVYWGHRSGEKTHRVSWRIAHNSQSIPDGLCVLHTCDNGLCVNPKHLYLGTQLDNIRDRVLRGRSATGAAYPGFTRFPENEQETVRLYKAGLSTRQVAEKMGMSKSIVALIVKGIRSQKESTAGNRGTAKVTPEIVIQIRSSPEPAPVLANRYGVSRGTIEDIRSKRSWAHILMEAVPVTRKPLVTACRHGHPYDETNNWKDRKTGKRACRVCSRLRMRVRKQAAQNLKLGSVNQGLL